MPAPYSRPTMCVWLLLVALVLCALLPVAPVQAQQFRAGQVTWSPVSGDTVEFTVFGAYRRSDFDCIDPTVWAFVPCAEADAYPGVGDIFEEFIGMSVLDFGDGTTTSVLMFMVTEVDVANDWIFAVALDSMSLPSIDTTISHTYGAPGDYVAALAGCCRLFETLGPNSHVNNPSAAYRVQTVVNAGSTNSSPASTLPHVVNCPTGADCSFVVPATDPDMDPVTYRLATAGETGDATFEQPGPTTAPNAATVDEMTGEYRWDTTGALDAADVGNPGGNTLYSTQVILDEGESSAAVDFMIQLVSDTGAPPVITLSETGGPMVDCASALFLDAGDMISITIVAMGDDMVTLEADMLPGDAMFLPGLPTSGNPVSTTFLWTPMAADEGVHAITFTATDAVGRHSTCGFSIEVMVEPILEDPPVALDVLPEACRNPLNAKGRGILPVAVLGMADLDVTDIDVSTLMLEGVGPMRTGLEDVATPFLPLEGKSEPFDCTDEGPDGFADLTMKFDRQAILAAIAPVVDGEARILRLTGNLLDGTPISGEDVVVILKKGH